MNKPTKLITLALAVSLGLSGCLNVPQGQDGKSYKQLADELAELKRQSESSQSQQRVTITDGPLMTNQKVPLRRYPWLMDRKVNLDLGKKPLNGHEIVKALHKEGLNITSVMPLESFTYAGYGFSGVDAETALRLIFPAMGLDYSIDNERRIITIVPMRSKTWTLNINPQRSSSFTSSSVAGSLDAAASLTSALNSASNGPNGGMGGGLSNANSGNGGNGGKENSRQGDSKIESKSDFWKSIKEELESRTSVLVPVNGGVVNGSAMPSFGGSQMDMSAGGMPNLPMGNGMMPMGISGAAGRPAGDGAGTDLYRAQRLGRVAVNADTGAITVQGPQWLIAEIDEYIEGVKREFSTAIQFEGRLLLVTTSKEKSEGLDLTAFANFAGGDLGMIINNNPAGGITISAPSVGVPPVMKPGGSVIGSTGIGFQKLKGNPANLFVNYLESVGDVAVTQRPVLSTTSGTPAEFSRIETDLFSQVSQSAVAGTNGGGTIATTNQQIPIKFGTLLRVNPKIDMSSGLVRTQITLNVAVRSNVKTIEQYITDVNGTQKVPQTITLPSNIDYNGETLLRDGDTVIIGGQVEETDQATGSGVTGYENAGPLAGLIGSTKREKRVQTYYLVLTARVYSRG